MKIDLLIVDAYPALRRMMHRTLRMGTLKVEHIHEAANSEQAHQLLDEHWADGIIASWHVWMNEQTRFAEWLRSDEVMHEIPTIIVTADGREQTLEQIAEFEPAGLLIKPFQPESLYRKVKKMKTYEIG